jgi:hypothetical protein
MNTQRTRDPQFYREKLLELRADACTRHSGKLLDLADLIEDALIDYEGAQKHVEDQFRLETVVRYLESI